MKIFVYEFVCGGGLASEPLPDSLRGEGLAMLRSVSQDFAECHKVITCLDRRIHWFDGNVEVHQVGQGQEKATVQSLAKSADVALIVAPESDGILVERSKWIDEVGTSRLGPGLDAIKITTDKLELNGHLLSFGVSAAGGRRVNLKDGLPDGFSLPAVLKPVDGAGSQVMFLIPSAAKAAEVFCSATNEGLEREALLQPFYSGTPVSVSFLLGPKGGICLMPCRQHLSEDGCFRYLGGSVPLSRGIDRAVSLANRAIACVSDLWGFVSVDLILGSTAEEDRVIEINPRLSTSYVGLRELFNGNLAEVMLSTFIGQIPSSLSWKPGTVYFTADGQTEFGLEVRS